jgi:hypothetical protein
MTELERARAHLQVCQYDLAGARLLQWCLAGKRRLRFVEEAYLAALSWVWDAQERQKIKIGDTVSWIDQGRRRFSKIVAIHEAA